MFIRCFERTNNINGDYEVINLGTYGYEWWVNNELVKSGLVDNFSETVELLLNQDFIEIK